MTPFTLANREAEQAVLGALLIEGDLIQECILLPQHFTPGGHQLIFKSMRDLDEDGKKIDIVTVVTRLGDALQQIGGLQYLSDLADAVPTTANFSTYQQLILEGYKLRETQNIASQLSENPEKIADYYNRLTQLQEVAVKKSRTTKEILVEIVEDISKRSEGLTGIATGLIDFDNMTAGLQNGDLIIVAARPSVGKTAFALNLGISNCQNGGFTNIFSLEMKDKQLVQRMLSTIANVNAAKWRDPYRYFTEDDHKKISRAIGFFDAWEMDIRDKPGQTVFDIRSTVRKNMREHPDKRHLVIIDYLQLMAAVGRFERHDLAIGHISKELKNLAREFNVPVILLSQLSRGVEQRQEKRPMMSDIRDSGSVEQDADVICFLYRDDYYDKESENKNIVEVIISKQRNGPVGTVEMAFIKEYGKFVNLDRRRSSNEQE